jgi:insulysin
LDYKVEYNSEGIAISVRGYNQKLGLLTDKIVHKLRHLQIQPDRFAVVHEQMRRDYKNFSREAPHSHARYFMMMATIEPRWGWEEKLPILETITQEDVEKFLPTMLRSVRCQWLIHGNMRSKDALALVEEVEKILAPSPMRVPFLPVQRAVKFKRGHTYIMHRQEFNEQESNSALYNWYQAGHQDDTKHAAVMDLMQEILSEPCYDTLRTKEQLGYIVWSGLRHSCGSTGWRITIQSSEKDPSYLDERAENFIVSMAEVRTLNFSSNR